MRKTLLLIPFLFALTTGSVSFGSDVDYSLASNPFRAPKLLSPEEWRENQENYKIHWKVASRLRHFERITDKSTIFRSLLQTNLQYHITRSFNFYSDFAYNFQTGSSQSRYGDLSPNSGAFVNDAYAHWAILPREVFTIEVGALSQRRTLDNPVFIKGSAFPGISERIKLQWGDFSLAFRAQQLIPYSQTQDVELVDTENTPTLNTETIELEYSDSKKKIELMFGLFNYSELPATVANASRILGNTINGQDLNAEFEFDFKGWFANFETSWIVNNRIHFETNVHLVENREAATRRNRGQEFSGGFKVLYPKTSYFLGGGVFSIEADAAPAFYNSSSLGNNNRDGWFARIGFELAEYEAVRVAFDYANSKVLNTNIFQEDQDYYQMSLETRFRGI